MILKNRCAVKATESQLMNQFKRKFDDSRRQYVFNVLVDAAGCSESTKAGQVNEIVASHSPLDWQR